MSGDHQEDVDGEDPGGHVDHHGAEVESEDCQQDIHLDECENEVEGEVEDVYEDGNGDKGGKVECEDCKQDVQCSPGREPTRCHSRLSKASSNSLFSERDSNQI